LAAFDICDCIKLWWQNVMKREKGTFCGRLEKGEGSAPSP